MAYVGCILFGLLFLVMTAQQNGTLASRLEGTFKWIHGWAPFSYIIIAIVVLSPVIMMKVMNSWPKREEPEDPMAKYRRQAAQGLIEEPEE
jgi:NADH:ubiquinone oxidoreductase subunit 6 (subunit J)